MIDPALTEGASHAEAPDPHNRFVNLGRIPFGNELESDFFRSATSASTGAARGGTLAIPANSADPGYVL
jgi:hypothetical protein